VLRHHVPEPALRLRLDIALCRLYRRDGSNEALIGKVMSETSFSITQIADANQCAHSTVGLER
jgi:hypothetical protein